MTDAIVLAVVVPIFGAMISLIAGLRFERSGWTVAALTCLAQLGAALVILFTVVQDGKQRYELAGFSPPAGIELVADGISALVMLLVATVSLAVVVYARQAGPRGNAFYTLYLLLAGGLAGVTLTGDIFNMYVFLEITGLAAYALVASGDSTKSAVAGLKYLILGTIGASLFLLGVGYAYVATGTLNMVDLSEQLAAAGYSSRLVLGAFGLLVTGLLVKVALFPVHTWQPGAYSNAPDSVSVYISALVSTVAAYAVARVLYTVFTPDYRNEFVEKFDDVGGVLADMDGHIETRLLANVGDENDMFISSRWEAKEDAMEFFSGDAFRETVDWGRDVLDDRPRHVFLA